MYSDSLMYPSCVNGTHCTLDYWYCTACWTNGTMRDYFKSHIEVDVAFWFEGQFKARKILRITYTYCAYHLAEYVTIMWIHGRIQSRLDAALVYRAPWQFGVREHIGALLMTFGALARQAWTVWRPLYQFKYWCSNRNTLSCYYYITIFANMMWSCCLCFQ